ncbi:MAG: SRPBCC domain-containing protein [Pseudoclavibacter sp.]|nr:SRPBCC domain-containing protein [Pseudoclavibacter sp.]
MFEPSLDITTRFEVPAEYVWQALVDPELRRRWWPELDFEPKKGGAVVGETVRPGKKKWRKTRGRVVRVKRGRRIDIEWRTKRGGFHTRVSLFVSQQKHHSKLRVVEEGFPRDEYAEILIAECRDGWRQHFGDLAAFLEGTKNIARIRAALAAAE